MPDIINSSFDPRLPFPLDVRQQVQDMNALYAIPATSRWEGMVVYVRGAEIPYILKGGVTNSFWVPFQFNSGGGLLPNGIVIYGESQQSGNDILLNDAWVWRIDQVDYQSSDDVITIAPAAAGNVRVDIIVGDNLSNFVLVTGTEVASPGPAIEPNIPPNTVPLLRVEVNDTGITAFEDFALSAFVRFDINNQGLIPSQRLNARTNIQAVSKDTNDTRTGGLTNNGKVTIDLDESSSSLPILELYQQGVLKHLFSGEQARIIPHLLRVNEPIAPTARGASFRGSTNGGDPIFEIQNAAGTKIFYPRGTGGIGQLRSNASDTSIRRDENYLTYPVTISGTGKLNDVALSNGVGAIKFSAGVTEVSGIDPNGDTKELLIWSDNPTGITLPAEDVLSIAANRFYRDVNIPYQTWVRLVYDGDLARWVNSNTGELQETDARYFEVTSDVLTLKYILPDIAALQAFVRGPAVLAYVSDSVRGGYFNYVAEVDFVGTADFGISFPAQDGGYWVRSHNGEIRIEWWDVDPTGVADSTVGVQAFFNAVLNKNTFDSTIGKSKGIIGKGFFRITSTISLSKAYGVIFEGFAVDSSTFFFDSSNDVLFNINQYVGLTFRDLTFLCGTLTYSGGLPQVNGFTDINQRTNKAFSFISTGGGTLCFFENIRSEQFSVVFDSTNSVVAGDSHIHTNCKFRYNRKIWDNTNTQALIWRFDSCQMHFNEFCFYNPGARTLVLGGDYINGGTFLYARLTNTTNGFMVLGGKFENFQNIDPTSSPKWIDAIGNLSNIQFINCNSATGSNNLDGKTAFTIGGNSDYYFKNCDLDGDMEILANSLVDGVSGKVTFDSCDRLPPINQTLFPGASNVPFNIELINQSIGGNSRINRNFNGLDNTFNTQNGVSGGISNDVFFWEQIINTTTISRSFQLFTIQYYVLLIKKITVCCNINSTNTLTITLWKDNTKTNKIIEFTTTSTAANTKEIYEFGIADFITNTTIDYLSDPLFLEITSVANAGATSGRVYFELIQTS